MENDKDSEKKTTYFFGKSKEAPNGIVVPNINPDNEIKGGAEEKLINDVSRGGFTGKNQLSDIETGKGSFGEEDFNKKSEQSPLSRISGNINTSPVIINKSGAKDGIPFTPIAKKRNRMLAPLIIGIIALLAVSGFAAYYFMTNKWPSATSESPEQKILRSALIASNDAKTYKFSGDMNFDSSSKIEEKAANASFGVTLSGQADEREKDNPKLSSNLNLKIKVPTGTEIGDQNFAFNVDMASFGRNIAYYRLNSFDFGSGFAGVLYGSMLNPYKEKWYSLNMKKLEEISSLKSANSSPKFDYDYFGKAAADMIKKMYEKNEFFRFQNNMGDTKIGDMDTYHYRTKIDGKKAAAFYLDIAKEIGSIYGYGNDENLKKDYLNSLKKLEEDLKKYDYIVNRIAENVNSEVWIGKEDGYLHRIKIDGKFDEKFVKMIQDEMVARKDIDQKAAEAQKSAQGWSLSFLADFAITDFNGPVDIEQPKNAEDLTKTLEDVFSGFGGTGMKSNNKNSLYDGDNDGLTDNEEAFYGTDSRNPDTDGDGFKDGNEVSKGFDPVKPGNAKLDYQKLFAPKG